MNAASSTNKVPVARSSTCTGDAIRVNINNRGVENCHVIKHRVNLANLTFDPYSLHSGTKNTGYMCPYTFNFDGAVPADLRHSRGAFVTLCDAQVSFPPQDKISVFLAHHHDDTAKYFADQSANINGVGISSDHPTHPTYHSCVSGQVNVFSPADMSADPVKMAEKMVNPHLEAKPTSASLIRFPSNSDETDTFLATIRDDIERITAEVRADEGTNAMPYTTSTRTIDGTSKECIIIKDLTISYDTLMAFHSKNHGIAGAVYPADGDSEAIPWDAPDLKKRYAKRLIITTLDFISPKASFHRRDIYAALTTPPPDKPTLGGHNHATFCLYTPIKSHPVGTIELTFCVTTPTTPTCFYTGHPDHAADNELCIEKEELPAAAAAATAAAAAPTEEA